MAKWLSRSGPLPSAQFIPHATAVMGLYIADKNGDPVQRDQVDWPADKPAAAAASVPGPAIWAAEECPHPRGSDPVARLAAGITRVRTTR